MVTKASSFNLHNNQPIIPTTTSPFPNLHLHPDSLLHQLGLPTDSLQQTRTRRIFSPSPFAVGFLSLPQKLSRFGFPETSWRSKCPYQVPPPLILAKGVEEAKWGEDEKREYVRKRFRRKAGGIDVNPLIPILVPNVLLVVCFLILNPAHDD